MRSKQKNVKTVPLVSPFPGSASLHHSRAQQHRRKEFMVPPQEVLSATPFFSGLSSGSSTGSPSPALPLGISSCSSVRAGNFCFTVTTPSTWLPPPCCFSLCSLSSSSACGAFFALSETYLCVYMLQQAAGLSFGLKVLP